MQNNESLEQQDQEFTPANVEQQYQEQFAGNPQNSVEPQACSTCGQTPAATPATMGKPQAPSTGGQSNASYIYAIGRFEARFPHISIEKEFWQAAGRSDTKGLTDRATFHKVLSERQNRYLVRELCWVMTIQGLDAYILLPRDPADHELLVESLRPKPGSDDLDVAIGMTVGIAPANMCNGLTVPIAYFNQTYSFPRPQLMEAVNKEHRASAEELFDRIMQMADNFGNQDDHRALNYLILRYPRIYEVVAEAFAKNDSLTSVNARRSRLSGDRKILDVIFSFTNRTTDVISQQFVRVDVTDMYPFLVTKMSPYYNIS
jgi:hypothetical protein